MRFTLSVKNRLGTKTIITQFDPQEEQHNLYSTYNEKVSLADNDQITLTFSLMRKIPNENGELILNPFLKNLVFGAKICLETSSNLYELIITQIAPKTSKGNTTYDFTCQDEVSYKWSRINLGYSYSTMERGGVKTLYQIVGDVLRDCKLDKQWVLKRTNPHLYPNTDLLNEKITLEVEGSNPYNTIIEALNTLNASMLVNYRNREIRFYQKDKVIFSGYRYRPETSLRSLSATYNIDELATILHVVGGTDEKDMNITLVPPMPESVKNYLKPICYIMPTNNFEDILTYKSYNMFAYNEEIKKRIVNEAGVNIDLTTEGIHVHGNCNVTTEDSSGRPMCRFIFTKDGDRIPFTVPAGCYKIKCDINKNTDTFYPTAHVAIKGKTTNYYDASLGNPKYFVLPEKSKTMYLDLRLQTKNPHTLQGQDIDCMYQPQLLPQYHYLIDEDIVQEFNYSAKSNVEVSFTAGTISSDKPQEGATSITDSSISHNKISLSSDGLNITSTSGSYSAVIETGGRRIPIVLPKGRYKLHTNFVNNTSNDALKNIRGGLWLEFFDQDRNSITTCSSSNATNNGIKEFELNRTSNHCYMQIRLQGVANNSTIDNMSFAPYIEYLDADDSYAMPTPAFNYVNSKPVQQSGLEIEIYNKERDEVQQFCVIANKVPSLGQFLYNFDFFLQNGLMTQEQYLNIKNIFDVQMKNINIKLKPMLITYYNLMWELQKVRFDMESLLEQMNAAYMRVIKEHRKAKKDQGVIDSAKTNALQHFNEYKLLISSYVDSYLGIYGDNDKLVNGSTVPELSELIDEFNLYKQIRDESRYYYYHYQNLYHTTYGSYFDVLDGVETTSDNYDYDKAELQGNILNYYNKFYLALQLCGVQDEIRVTLDGATIANIYYCDVDYLAQNKASTELKNIGTGSIRAEATISLLHNNIVDRLNNEVPSYGMYNVVLDLEDQIQQLWNVLYKDYSAFIYEATYENSDELDSLSLYNQAVVYFENYHHPKSSYSVEVLNIDELEQIGTPNLKVNSRIRIYNEDLGLDEGTTYIDGADGIKLNNISYTTNELLITALNYDLRKSAAVSITVERIIQHQTILQKLIKSIK